MSNRFNNYEQAKLARDNKSFTRSCEQNYFNILANDVLESIADASNEVIRIYVEDTGGSHYVVELLDFNGVTLYPFSKGDPPDKDRLIRRILLILESRGIPVHDGALKSKVISIKCR